MKKRLQWYLATHSKLAVSFMALRIVTAILVLIFLISLFIAWVTEDESGGPAKETYDSCVADAADHLSDVVPGLSYADALEQAETSPRCGPLR